MDRHIVDQGFKDRGIRTRRSEFFVNDGDTAGVAIWRGIIDVIGQLAKATPPEPMH
jgi:hypothetical protein